jgi:hypothetical protein
VTSSSSEGRLPRRICICTSSPSSSARLVRMPTLGRCGSARSHNEQRRTEERGVELRATAQLLHRLNRAQKSNLLAC